MAAPRHRRRGFSRRVQYGLFAGYVIAVVGIVAGIGMVLIAHFDPRAFATIRGLSVDAGAGLTSITRIGVRQANDAGSEVGAYFDAAAQNAALQRELAVERRRSIAAKALIQENSRLKKLALVVEHLPRPILSARVIGSTVSGQRRFATLAAGSTDGVKPGMPVRTAEGLIGRVFETGLFASRVLLLTDGDSAVPVRLPRNGVAALVTGRGDGSLEIRGLTAGGSTFQRGDLAVTSGTGGVYAPNIPVAVVTAVHGDRAVAFPLADPATADLAVVYPIYQAPVDERPAQPKP
jgi:rod shape-determining protein MreC